MIHSKPKLVKHSIIIATLATIAAVFSYFLFDAHISTYFNSETLLAFRKLNRELTDIGLSENFFILTVCLGFISHWLSYQTRIHPWVRYKTLFLWLRKWSLNFFVSLIFSGIILHFFKFTLGRQRPHVSDTFEHNIFHFFEFNSYYQSMPSGHTQVLFCSATLFALLWPKASWFLYLVAFLLSFTRVVVHAHFLSDVFLGAAVGHIGALWCLWILENKFPKHFSLAGGRKNESSPEGPAVT